MLLVFALINRPYILDLRPGNSFVEYMLQNGYDVYLLDWGVPGPEDKQLKLDDYVLEYLPRAIRKLKAVSGSDEFSLLGSVHRRTSDDAVCGVTTGRRLAQSDPPDGAAGLRRQAGDQLRALG